MSIHSKDSVMAVENKLKEKYKNLISIFEGSPYVSPHPEEENQKHDRVVINSSELRMAIDELTAVLKEVKRYAK